MSEIYNYESPEGAKLSVTADVDGVVLRLQQAGAMWHVDIPLSVAQAELLQLSLEQYVVDAARSSMRAALAVHLASHQDDKPKGCGGECGSCGSCGHE